MAGNVLEKGKSTTSEQRFSDDLECIECISKSELKELLPLAENPRKERTEETKAADDHAVILCYTMHAI